jgi:4-diphosphocytidyl-2-C-methyl-D-erythritol kinase
MRVTVPSPAKLNLFLAVTGRRADGFHDLVSVVAPLEFGDELEAVAGGEGSGFALECDVAGVPLDDSNLVLRAAAEFARRTGWKGGARFRLRKRIPVGAGLGGGSSNAVAALRALNYLSHDAATVAQLEEMAAALGSDCPLFLAQAPVVMRGRGERLERIPAKAEARIRGHRVVVFKPSFGVSTPWAYGRMVARAGDYLSATLADARVATWLDGDASVASLLFNSMEPAVFEKYLALPTMLEWIRRECGVAARMSGSGSACFAVPRDDDEAKVIVSTVRRGWGEGAFVEVTKLA